MRKQELLKGLEKRTRDSLNNEFPPHDTFHPKRPLTDLVDTTLIKQWASVGRQACIYRHCDGKSGKLLNSQLDALDAVAAQFGKVESAAAGDFQTASEAVASFEVWRESVGEEAWDQFVSLQEPVADRAAEAAAEKADLAKYTDCTAMAREAALGLCHQHGKGPNRMVGTVIAGLADSVSGEAWTDTSRTAERHPVMDALLAGVPQVEEWAVDVCGEVHAMIQYLNARGITNVKDIPRRALFSHAETWNSRTRRWQGRAACGNCNTWLEKIGANRA